MLEIKSFEAFQTVISTGLKIINVKSEKCNVCISVTAQLENLLECFDVDAFFLYADRVEEFSGQYLVFTVPTILIFHEGKEILRESRFINFSNIERIIEIYGT